MFTFWKTCLLAAASAVLLCTVNCKADTRLDGAGATFPAPIYAKWIQVYNKAHPDIKVDYQAKGSGWGIKNITDRTIIFAGSDAPMTSAQEKAAPAKILHLPTVAGPEVMAYNLPGVTGEITLDGDAIAGIYLGAITQWDDPKLKALNPKIALPNTPITVVHRADGSGTTFIFTNYLCKVSKDWKDKVGNATAVSWPVGQGGNGNDGVAKSVMATQGAIGYLEFAYAVKNKIAYATQINKAGKPVRASIEGVVEATSNSVTDFPADLKVSITDAPGDKSYPICGFTYFLVYQDLSYTKDKASATALLHFIHWCLTDGQGMAKDLSYAKLPKDAQDKVLAKLKTIQFDGEPILK